jgi:hypothetical protein
MPESERVGEHCSPDATGRSRSLRLAGLERIPALVCSYDDAAALEELKADDMIVVNPLSEIVRSLPGFDLSE